MSVTLLPDEVDEELERHRREAGAPNHESRNLIGVKMMAPLVLRYGREEQRTRFVRPAFTCEEIWCQLFSEPDAGSDLVAVSTRAVRDGDGWIVTGQKVWTTFAHIARWGLLLARTGDERRGHRGLTFFILDMTAPGVEVRPLRQITGEAEYNEVFLSEVRVPDDQRLGEVGAGWSLAMATLKAERESLADLRHVVSALIDDARSLWGKAPAEARTDSRRDRLARLFVQSTIFRLLVQRNPEAPLVKLHYGSFWQELTGFCLELRGPEALLVDTYEMVQPDTFTSTFTADLAGDGLAKAFLASQALTIAGGTTNINKNVIAERLLGLPTEPRAQEEPG